MASTSTGYAKSIISREQPSSSGQVMSLTSGCLLNVQSGAHARVRPGGVFVGQPISQITTSGIYGTTVAFGGAYWMNPTSSGNVTLHIAQPAYAGQRCTVIISNSSKKKARIIMGNTLVSVGASSCHQITLTTASIKGTGQLRGFNRHVVELIALTTVRVGITNPNSTVTAAIDLSTGKTS